MEDQAAHVKELIQFCRDNHCAQVSVLHHGNILVEEVFSTHPVDVAAVQKGLIAILIGIAQEKSLLETFDNMNHHIEPEWTQLGPWDEAKLQIEHLMQMTTGMDDELKPEGNIGETWRYNNVAYQLLKKILSLHTGLSLNELSSNWLFEPLNMHESDWRDRDILLPDGTPYTALFTTAADLLQLGKAVLNRGKPIMNDEFYIDQLSQPGSTENPSWGLLWWNNNQDRFMVPNSTNVFTGPPINSAPRDLISARGYKGNHLGISPSLDLVAALTIRPDSPGNKRLEQEFWSLLTPLLP
jgi:CubicO group peptidase (beta-lactamase class C family)